MNLPKLLKYIDPPKKHGRQGAELVFPIHLRQGQAWSLGKKLISVEANFILLTI